MRHSELLLLLAAAACRSTPDDTIGKACLAGKASVTPKSCYTAGLAQGVNDASDADNSGYEDGYEACQAAHDTGADTGQ